MKRSLLIITALLSLLLVPAWTADPPAPPPVPLKSDSGEWRFYPAACEPGKARVLLIGDSIMNAYRQGVSAQIKDRATVDAWLTPLTIKSRGLSDDLRTVLDQGPYDVVHFNIGLHEWMKGFIPEGQYEPLLRAYVKNIQAHAGHATLIWASTTQMTVQDHPTELDPANNPTIVGRNAIADRVMQEYGITVNDLYSLMSDKLALAKGDKFHWTPNGSALHAAAVAAAIAAALDKRYPGPTPAASRADAATPASPKPSRGNTPAPPHEKNRKILLTE